jgi:hypothetical protein
MKEVRMEIDRRAFFKILGGAAAVAAMSSEAKADALEEHMMRELDQAAAQDQTSNKGAAEKFPTAAEVQAQIETRLSRQGVGNLLVSRAGNVKRLPPMPANPTLLDFFKLRFNATSNHVRQSANRALKTGMPEEISSLACSMTPCKN